MVAPVLVEVAAALALAEGMGRPQMLQPLEAVGWGFWWARTDHSCCPQVVKGERVAVETVETAGSRHYLTRWVVVAAVVEMALELEV